MSRPDRPSGCDTFQYQTNRAEKKSQNNVIHQKMELFLDSRGILQIITSRTGPDSDSHLFAEQGISEPSNI